MKQKLSKYLFFLFCPFQVTFYFFWDFLSHFSFLMIFQFFLLQSSYCFPSRFFVIFLGLFIRDTCVLYFQHFTTFTYIPIQCQARWDILTQIIFWIRNCNNLKINWYSVAITCDEILIFIAYIKFFQQTDFYEVFYLNFVILHYLSLS